VPVEHQGTQFIQLKELKGDADGIDFVVRPETPQAPKSPPPNPG